MSPAHLWVRHRAAVYMRGQGLAFGATGEIYPRKAHTPNTGIIYVDNTTTPVISSGTYSWAKPKSFDFVIAGPRTGLTENPAGVVRDLANLVKPGGHLILWLYHSPEDVCKASQYIIPEAIELLEKTGLGWKIKDTTARGDMLVVVAKRVDGKKITYADARSTRSACVVRYGALGDLIQITPLLRELKQDGYHVTVNATTYSAGVLENNPNIDNLIVQEREIIPNPDLGVYWGEWEKEYDKYINLSESIEGTLLKLENRRDFFTPKSWREGVCSANYTDHTLALGGYTSARSLRPELFFTKAETRDAEAWRKANIKTPYMFLWSPRGTSHHKVMPIARQAFTQWLDDHPDVTLVSIGGNEVIPLEFDHPQVVKSCGTLAVRQTLALISLADCVIGPESMATNAAAAFSMPKVVVLSHSSPYNLCAHWENVIPVTPDLSCAPCYPCHQLHYTLESCPQRELFDKDKISLGSGPACAFGGISPEDLHTALNMAYEILLK